ncbi:MAG: hypothetical protein ACI307_04835 [Sodaliphilus sp.]
MKQLMQIEHNSAASVALNLVQANIGGRNRYVNLSFSINLGKEVAISKNLHTNHNNSIILHVAQWILVMLSGSV